MKAILFISLVLFSFMAIGQSQPQVVRHSMSSSVGGESTDTTTLATVWTYSFAFSGTATHLLDGRFEADTVSGTANYTIAIEHSWNYSDWDVLSTVSQTADRDTFLNFQDTTRRPYVRFRNTATSGTQVVKNKVYFSFINQ